MSSTINGTSSPALKIRFPLKHQRCGLFENGRLSCRSCSGSVDSMTDSAAAVAEFHNGGEENKRNGWMPAETKGFINNGVSQLEIVNNGVLKNVGSTQVCK